MEIKYEHTKFLIERFDHYFDSVNNKGAFYIGLNTFIFSGISIGYTSISNNIEKTCIFWLFLISIFSLCILSIIYTLRAITPFMKDNHANDDKVSLIYFGGIAKYELGRFMEKYEGETESSIILDMTRQAHSLAKGLATKFNFLRIAGFCLLSQFVLITIFFMYIIQNITQ
ncbi:Pycsar system effector family protein [Limnovirga soli]|uniref:Pycsar effector protein domain-containing protein n=1 Tax=Limnovirga soli TaxID=2656915 RepID=A0A8J8JPQ9_9BACT|nr:Pycsar system effector family protein [Limnovirga soli]NNV53867.1 hypothetical protein [Limnovirga soli]